MTNKEKAVALIKTIETQSPDAMAFVNSEKFIHHTVRKPDGIAGIMDFLMATPKGSSTANSVRVIQDGDYVILHTDFDFYGPHIGFDVFRFEEGKVVEMWDCIQPKVKSNFNGHTMIDGVIEITDRDKTEENKIFVRNFVNDVMVDARLEAISNYYNGEQVIQHNPQIGDGISGLMTAYEELKKQGIRIKYDTIHKVLGEGNFVLTISEGFFGPQHCAFFDLFRVENGKIAEHWDVREPIAPKNEWKNTTGRF